jgi:O-antigen/teichoic acid export membrane protein
VLRLGPARFLTLTNILTAALGLAVSLFIARTLGPELLGLMGVIAGINGSVMGFVDVRLNDVTAKLFFERDRVATDVVPEYRAGVLWVGVAGSGLVAVTTAVVSASIGNLFIHRFTQQPTAWWWLPAAALTLSVSTTAAALTASLRLANAFYWIGVVRLGSQALAVITAVLFLTRAPTIGSAYMAALAGAVGGMLLALAAFLRTWKAVVPLRRPMISRAMAAFRQNGGVLFHGNLLGYAKLFQRSADVLLVAYFAGDRETGIYKLARSLTDGGLAVLQDALYQVHYPSLLDAFARRDSQAFRRVARTLMSVSAVITAVLVAGELTILPLLTRTVLGAKFAGVTVPVMILTTSFVFIVGFYPWLWALFTSTSEMRPFTVAVFVAVVFQYAIAVVLFYFVGRTATSAMLSAVAYYLCMVPIAFHAARSRWPAYVLGAEHSELAA